MSVSENTMDEKLLRAICIVFAVLAVVNKSEGSFFDSIPIVSQAKSLFQVIGGDADGARRTQEQFTRTNPVAAVVRSSIEAGKGRHEEARDTWREFGGNAYSAVKSVPLVGHGIAVGHYAAGKREEGNQIMKDATRSIAVGGGAVVGGIVGGPAGGAAGAVAGGAAYDGIVTGIDSAVHRKYRPYGLVDYGTNVAKGESSPGETFDTGLGIVLDAVGGATGAKQAGGGKSVGCGKSMGGTKQTGGIKPSNPIQNSPLFGADNPKRIPTLVQNSEGVQQTLRRGLPDSEVRNSIRRPGHDDGISLKRPRPDPETPLRRQHNGDRTYVKRPKLEDETLVERPKLEDKTSLKRPRPDDGTPLRRQHPDLNTIFRRRKVEFKNKQLRELQSWEMAVINTDGPVSIFQETNPRVMYNCAYCTLGGLKRITVDRIIESLNQMDIDGPAMAVKLPEIESLFKSAGYERVSIKPFQPMGPLLDSYLPVGQHPIGVMLQNNLKIGQC